MVSRAEAAAKAYPNNFDLTPPERMDNIRHALRAADDVMFSEESIKEAAEAARESMWTRPSDGVRGGYPTHLSRQDYETIVRAVVGSLRGT